MIRPELCANLTTEDIAMITSMPTGSLIREFQKVYKLKGVIDLSRCMQIHEAVEDELNWRFEELDKKLGVVL